MTAETGIAQPVFDVHNPGASLDVMEAELPIVSRELRNTMLGDANTRQIGEGSERNGDRLMEDGDDWRDVDHNATANDPDHEYHIRVHLKDVTPKLWIVTDALQSRNRVGYPGEFSEQALALSGVTHLMRIARKQRIPFAVIASDDNGIATEHPRLRSTRGHLQDTAEMLGEGAQGDTVEHKPEFHLADLLEYAGEQCSRGVVALVSDFREKGADDAEFGWRDPLEALVDDRQNQILAIETTNPWDFKLPVTADRFSVGSRKARHLTGQQKAQLEHYMAQQSAITAEALASVGAHHVTLSNTDKLWSDSLITGLQLPARGE